MPELADTTDAIEAADWRLSADMIGTAIGDLTDLQQQVIALRFGAGLSLAETADIMNRTQNAIKNLQHNALAALRRRLTADQATG